MKKFFAFVLTVMLALSLTVPASASWSTEYSENQKLSYGLGEQMCTVPYIDADGYITICESYGLSSAQKITALASSLHPVQHLESALENLERHMDPDVARFTAIYSGMKPLDGYIGIDSATRGALSVASYQDAYDLMILMKKMPEYQSVPEVQRIVDSYLEYTLAGSELRAGLKALTSYGYTGPDREVSIDEMNVKDLISYAHQIIETEEFRALMEPLSEVRRGNADTYSLNCRYEPEELDALWEQLAEAASVYQPGQVKMLKNMTLTIPVETYSSIDAWKQALGE